MRSLTTRCPSGPSWKWGATGTADAWSGARERQTGGHGVLRSPGADRRHPIAHDVHQDAAEKGGQPDSQWPVPDERLVQSGLLPAKEHDREQEQDQDRDTNQNMNQNTNQTQDQVREQERLLAQEEVIAGIRSRISAPLPACPARAT